MYKRQKPLHKGLGLIRRDKNAFGAAFFPLEGEFPVHMPPFKRGKGPFLYDYDENRYVDFELSRGSLIFGHAPPWICSMMKSWISKGYSGGFSVGVQHMLEKRISDLTGCAVSGRWLFFPSEFEAAAALYYIMGRYFDKERGTVIGHTGTAGSGFSPFAGLLLGARCPDAADADLDFVVLSEARETERDMAAKTVYRVKEGGGIFVSDETDLARYARMRAGASVYKEADIRLFGSYLSSGIPFGCIYVSESAVSRMRGIACYDAFTDIASFSFSLPLHTGKSTLRSLELLREKGGMEGFFSKQEKYFRLLDGRFFEQEEGLVYLKKGQPEIRYPLLHLELLRKGVYFPLSEDQPLTVSFAHTDEILKKCAKIVSSTMQEHVSGTNEGQR
ncbi:MAG: hypothetical protein JXQ30_08490 [Spirochaetes bacterium]|nr:hypothetical protein [Spirochaetota bacterium]